MDRLNLEGLVFFGYHGTEPWEKEIGRRFVVDVGLELDLEAAGRSDRLEDALDYREAYAAIRDVVQHESHELIERVGWRVLEELFGRFPALDGVRVRVAKTDAPIGGLNTATVIELVRSRAQWENRGE